MIIKNDKIYCLGNNGQMVTTKVMRFEIQAGTPFTDMDYL